ncbi:MAG: tetratricopeptide repeat protein, partial [Acidobacteriota bacterium]
TVLPAIDPAQAIALTEKGIRNNPDKWRLLQYLGYIYWRLGDFDKAARVYSQGAAMPGTPPFFKMMAAKMRTDSGSRETARAIYGQLLDDTIDQQTRENAELRLKRLDTLDELDAINGELNKFRERNDRCVNRLQDIINALVTVELPNNRDLRVNSAGEIVDTVGIPYLLDRSECKAGIDPKRSRLPIN